MAPTLAVHGGLKVYCVSPAAFNCGDGAPSVWLEPGAQLAACGATTADPPSIVTFRFAGLVVMVSVTVCGGAQFAMIVTGPLSGLMLREFWATLAFVEGVTTKFWNTLGALAATEMTTCTEEFAATNTGLPGDNPAGLVWPAAHPFNTSVTL
jgi:hypothetical protein